MRKFAVLIAAMATLSAVALIPTAADAGCYRLGFLRADTIGIISAPVPMTSTRTSASAGMAGAGTARAHQACLGSKRTRQAGALRRHDAEQDFLASTLGACGDALLRARNG